jgi:hypothetical protein
VSAAWAPSSEVPDVDTSLAARKGTRDQALAYQTSLKLDIIRGMYIDGFCGFNLVGCGASCLGKFGSCYCCDSMKAFERADDLERYE